jgi:ATP/maltotriose-dependent transcriptional regulator MalT
MMMNHGLGRYRQARDDAHFIASEFAQELAVGRIVAGWATIPVINLQSFLASSQWRLGDAAGGERACEAAYQRLAEFDHPYSRGLIDFVQAQIWIESGRLDDAIALMRASVRSCEINDIPTLYPCVVAMLAGALARGGHVAEAVTLVERALAERRYLAGGTYGEVFLRHNHGVALLRAGHAVEAVSAAQEAVECTEHSQQYGHRAEALFGLGEALVATGQLELAAVRFRDAAVQAQECEMVHIHFRSLEELQSLKVRLSAPSTVLSNREKAA